MFSQTRKMPLICLVEQGKAKKWYLTFIKPTRVIQDRLFMSDFDKYMLELEENARKSSAKQ